MFAFHVNIFSVKTLPEIDELCEVIYLFHFFCMSQKLHNITWLQFCGPFVDIYRGKNWEIAVMGHIVQHVISPTNCTDSRMVTVVVVTSSILCPRPFEIARPVLMTSSSGTTTNGPKDPPGS